MILSTLAGNLLPRTQQSQRAGACDGFGAPLHLQLAENLEVVPFHGAQGEGKPVTYFLIRESLGNQLKYLELALAQCLDQWMARSPI